MMILTTALIRIIIPPLSTESRDWRPELYGAVRKDSRSKRLFL